MRLGFCLHKDWTLSQPELLRRLADLGYDGVEVWGQACVGKVLQSLERALLVKETEEEGCCFVAVNLGG